MALTAAARPSTPPTERLAGPDVVRGVALIGVVVMNYHGYLLIASGDVRVGESWVNRLFDPFDGPLSTRFAATFVVVAGVGVTLLTRSAIGSPERVTAARWRLVRRGVLLYVVGLVVNEVWPGTILPYYGAMFVVAALLFTLRSRWLVVVGALAAAAGSTLHLWRFERERHGHSTTWLSSNESVRRFVLDVAVNGTHPLLPWLAFLCAGMILGRALSGSEWRRTTVGIGGGLVALTTIITWLVGEDDPRTAIDVMISVDPSERSLFYVASALGTALLAYAIIDWVAGAAPRVTEPLRVAGQMTLTLYLLHVVVFDLLVERRGLIEPAGLDTALAFAVVFWTLAIAGAVAWQHRYGRGPAERFYRGFGG